jgi:hypothetical protein
MRNMLLGLLCVACTGTAWAQTPPTTLPPAQSGATVLPTASPVFPMQPIEQASHGRLLAGPTCGTPNCGTPACCAAPTKTICVPEPATKVVVSYSSTCEKICFPKCTFGRGCNSDCDQGREGHNYQKKYLVKTVCIADRPPTKWVPVTAPACETGCGTQGILHNRRPAPAAVETIPQQPMKK